MGETAIAVTAIVGAISAIVTGFVSWSLANRRTSGNVRTTDADRLWKQNEQLIDALTTERGQLQARLESREGEIETLRRKVHDLEVKAQQSELAESECNDRADRLAVKVAALERALNIDTSEPHLTERVVIEGQNLEAKGPEPAA